MLRRVLAAVCGLFMLSAVGSSADLAADYYFWRPARPDAAPRPWVALLPGTSGLSIFDDQEHYFRAALWLNQRGVDALVIDYHGAAPFVAAAREGTPGDRLAAIVADALRVQRAQDRIPRECPGAAIGWALGGSGAWTLAAADTRDPAFKAVAMFYPALVRAQSYRNTLPVLVLQGTADDIMPERALRSFVGNRAGRSAPAEIVMLEGAAHGFDVPSLQPPRTLGSALVGRPQVFAYNADAARTAQQALERFLTDQGIIGGSCSAN